MHSETAPQAVCKFAISCGDITPPVGMYHRMWGAATHDRSEGIHRPLRATVALFAPLVDNSSAPNASVQNEASPGAAASAKPQILVGLDHCLLGAEEMRLEVFAQNARALALYTAMGFKPLHRLYGYELELAQDAIADCPIPIPNRLDASTAQQWLQARQPQDQAFQMSASMVPLLPPDTLFWQSWMSRCRIPLPR